MGPLSLSGWNIHISLQEVAVSRLVYFLKNTQPVSFNLLKMAVDKF
jgi:hypothetical protein